MSSCPGFGVDLPVRVRGGGGVGGGEEIRRFVLCGQVQVDRCTSAVLN